jgi:hypothetical protein
MELAMPGLADLRDQAVSGVSAPQTSEAIIRDIWPSVAANAAAAKFARSCYRSIFLAPIAWMALAPLYFKKTLAALPGLSFLAVRYRLTNRRLMICKGMQPAPTQEVPLDQIKDVVVHTDADSEFFFAGTLEVKDATGKTVMTLPGVREPESVRHHILQAAEAWGPHLHS